MNRPDGVAAVPAVTNHVTAKEVVMNQDKLKEYLDSHGVKYVVISHSLGYTSQEVAHSAHVPTDQLAKTVIVKIDGRLCMAVLPASHKVDLHLLRDVTGAKKVELATEEEFVGNFHGCEVGAMPPFGNIYGMDVFASEFLAEQEEIAFNACSHREVIKMTYRDFARLVQPKVIELAEP